MIYIVAIAILELNFLQYRPQDAAKSRGAATACLAVGRGVSVEREPIWAGTSTGFGVAVIPRDFPRWGAHLVARRRNRAYRPRRKGFAAWSSVRAGGDTTAGLAVAARCAPWGWGSSTRCTSVGGIRKADASKPDGAI